MLYVCIAFRPQNFVTKNLPKRRWQSICMCGCFDFGENWSKFGVILKFCRGFNVVSIKDRITRSFCIGTYLSDPEIRWVNSKHYSHNRQNCFCAKFGRQNCNISRLCSNVWQKCNVETVFNIVVSSFENCTYLCDIQAPEVNALINVHSVHVNCVPKTSPRRPKWKRIFPGF